MEAETAPGTCVRGSTKCSEASTSASAEMCMPGCAMGTKMRVFSQSAVRQKPAAALPWSDWSQAAFAPEIVVGGCANVQMHQQCAHC